MFLGRLFCRNPRAILNVKGCQEMVEPCILGSTNSLELETAHKRSGLNTSIWYNHVLLFIKSGDKIVKACWAGHCSLTTLNIKLSGFFLFCSVFSNISGLKDKHINNNFVGKKPIVFCYVLGGLGAPEEARNSLDYLMIVEDLMIVNDRMI